MSVIDLWRKAPTFILNTHVEDIRIGWFCYSFANCATIRIWTQNRVTIAY